MRKVYCMNWGVIELNFYLLFYYICIRFCHQVSSGVIVIAWIDFFFICYFITFSCIVLVRTAGKESFMCINSISINDYTTNFFISFSSLTRHLRVHLQIERATRETDVDSLSTQLSHTPQNIAGNLQVISRFAITRYADTRFATSCRCQKWRAKFVRHVQTGPYGPEVLPLLFVERIEWWKSQTFGRGIFILLYNRQRFGFEERM